MVLYSTKSVGLGFAVFSAVTFGGSGPFAKALIEAGFTPQQAAWLRILGAAALLVPLVLVFRGRPGLPAAPAVVEGAGALRPDRDGRVAEAVLGRGEPAA